MTAYAISAPMTRPAVARPANAHRVVKAHRVVNVRPLPTAAGRARRITVVLIVLALIAFFAPRAFAGAEAPTAVAFDTYTVAQGESLWSIAASLTGPGEDVHDTISELQTLNAMGDSSLQAGEQIHVPALGR